MTARYEFLKDVLPETLENLSISKTDCRREFRGLDIPMSTISPNGGDFVHAIEAIRDYNSMGDPILKIRVITDRHGGVNVTIPCSSEAMRQKYLDLRYQIRNQDVVWVTFYGLGVAGSPRPREIFLKAQDFRIYSDMVSDPDFKI